MLYFSHAYLHAHLLFMPEQHQHIPPEIRSHREHKEDRWEMSVRTLLLAHGQEISLYHNEAMDPVEEAWEKTEFPPLIQEVLRERQEAMKDYWTLRATFESPDWKQETADFVLAYLEQEGATLLKELGIENVRQLTPSQAIQLTTQIVARLMKYNYASLETEAQKQGQTREDNLPALALLTEGRAMKTDPSWEGNGVCRNYAAVEYTVFEALKSQQEPDSHLEQMEAIVVVGTEHLPYSVEAAEIVKERHAWNIFLLTPQKGEVHLSIIDPTWTATEGHQRDLPGAQSDYTFERMEGFMYSLAQTIAKTEPESWKAVTGFYGSMIRDFDNRPDPEAQKKRDFYTYRILKLLESIPEDGQKREEIEILLQDIEQRYLKILQDTRMQVTTRTGTRLRVLAHRRSNIEMSNRIKDYVQRQKQDA